MHRIQIYINDLTILDVRLSCWNTWIVGVAMCSVACLNVQYPLECVNAAFFQYERVTGHKLARTYECIVLV